MLVVKQTVKNVDGNYSSTWNLSEDQLNFLLTYAINALVAQGLAVIDDSEGTSYHDEVKYSEEQEKQEQLDFLEETDKERMHQA
jgi:hypothetical protein